MTEKNDKNRWIFYLVGLLITIVVLIAMPTMAKAIWNNDRSNTKQHIEIIERIVDIDKGMSKELNKINVEQMRQGTILSRIDRKL